jgi:hypothetical protein
MPSQKLVLDHFSQREMCVLLKSTGHALCYGSGYAGLALHFLIFNTIKSDFKCSHQPHSNGGFEILYSRMINVNRHFSIRLCIPVCINFFAQLQIFIDRLHTLNVTYY